MATMLGETPAPDWGELEDLLAGFARLAKSDAPYLQVVSELADHLLTALAAVGAAVWSLDGAGELRLDAQRNLSVLGDGVMTGDHRLLLIDACRRSEQLTIPPGQTPANPSEHTLLIIPIIVDLKAAGLVEVIQRSNLSVDALEGNLRFAGLLAELAAEHLRRHEVRRLRQQLQTAGQLERFLYNLHQQLEALPTAVELANEGRLRLGCDRVSVAIRQGRQFRLLAVSGVDSVDRRSPLVRSLEKLVARVATIGHPLWRPGGEEIAAPQVEAALDAYLDESSARMIGVVPLRRPASEDDRQPQPIIGTLVIENFNAEQHGVASDTTDAIVRHGAVALANALRFHAVPTLPFLRRRVPTRLGRSWRGFTALAVTVAIASTFFIEVDFNIHAPGELQPVVRRHVFAPRDGQVAVVTAAHGDTVTAGQTLLELSSPELDIEMQKIIGEHQATQQRSLAIESALLDYSTSLDPEGIKVSQLAAEQQELRELAASQRSCLKALRRQRDLLKVCSPISGRVLTWNTNEQLGSRPLRRGNRLMTVADTEGPWEAELRIPDDRVGPLLELLADKEARSSITPTFEVATEPGVRHNGGRLSIAQRTELDAENQPVVRVKMGVDASTIPNPRPGATVFAKINCGQRSLFYVWCHRLVDRVIAWIDL